MIADKAVGACPGRAVFSLWDLVEPFSPHGFGEVISFLNAIEECEGLPPWSPNAPRPRQLEAAAVVLDAFCRLLEQLDLSTSLEATRNFVLMLRDPTFSTDQGIREHARDLSACLRHETRSRDYFGLTGREARYYKNPRDGWEGIIDRFPEIGDDVDEASRCFAASRYTASVFHSIQIIEHGIIALGQLLDNKDHRKGFTNTAKRLEVLAEKRYSERNHFEKGNEAFLTQLNKSVHSLKDAWRNKISHAHEKLEIVSADFSPQAAEEILLATRAFMRRLQDGLPPSETSPVSASSPPAGADTPPPDDPSQPSEP